MNLDLGGIEAVQVNRHLGGTGVTPSFQVKNQRDEAIEYVNAIVKFYDDHGLVLANKEAPVEGLPAGEAVSRSAQGLS